VPGVESVSDGAYRRTIALSGGRSGTLAVSRVDGRDRLSLRLDAPLGGDLLSVSARVERLFDLAADPLAIGESLSGDPVLAPLVSARPGLRVPGAWDPFELAVRAILGQQVTVRAATTVAGRIAGRFGSPLEEPRDGLTTLFPAASELAGRDLTGLGLPGSRCRAISSLAEAVVSSDETLAPGRTLEELVSRLASLDGFGPWTAQYVALRAFHEPDAFPSSDLWIRRALGTDGRSATALQTERRAEAWRPFRAYAALHLWESVTERSDR
jgi:AraC family transcriptional regulator of adaptative response / DNA-3-methyladenine glycosylase II